MLRKALYLSVAVCCCLPWCTPPVALAAGLAFGLLGSNPWPKEASIVSKRLLKISVVGLGFAMDAATVLHTGRTSFAYTGVGIVCAMSFGLLAGRLLSVPFNPSFLISAGTAICGGSAIAAVCHVINAEEDETAVSLGTVFVLNSFALVLFPLIGTALRLTQAQFGLWAALGIHDMSSVVGAGLRYGNEALIVGTTVKLVRSLWIIPLVVSTAFLLRSRTKLVWPWFILAFLGTAWMTAAVPGARPIWNALAQTAKAGFTATLFLIGSGISLESVRKIGWRPMAMGVVLWLVLALLSLYFITTGLISL